MTLRYIKIFVSVYEHNSITKSADVLHLAQSSVSLAIKEMEEYYGASFTYPALSGLFYLLQFTGSPVNGSIYSFSVI